jgi:hypothetical protein
MKVETTILVRSIGYLGKMGYALDFFNETEESWNAKTDVEKVEVIKRHSAEMPFLMDQTGEFWESRYYRYEPA